MNSIRSFHNEGSDYILSRGVWANRKSNPVPNYLDKENGIEFLSALIGVIVPILVMILFLCI